MKIKSRKQLQWHTRRKNHCWRQSAAATKFRGTNSTKPIVRGRDCKLNSAEIDELVQAVMLRFFDRSRTFVYDRAKGKFRDYLGVMIYHCALNIIRQRRPNEVDCETVEQASCDPDRWQQEWRQHILTLAMKQLKLQLEETTFQAFEFYAVKGESPEKVAKFLKIPVNMVYVAKSRALKKLRKIVRALREEE